MKNINNIKTRNFHRYNIRCHEYLHYRVIEYIALTIQRRKDWNQQVGETN
jgi:hypothetical protein